MIFEWDERKDRADIAKHGIAFQLAASVFDDPFRLDDLNRVVAGEERRHVIGMGGDTLLVLFVVYTSRSKHGQETIRIISAQKLEAFATHLPPHSASPSETTTKPQYHRSCLRTADC